MIASIIVIAYFTTAIRLFLYKRGDARYSAIKSLLAYFLAVACASQAVNILLLHAIPTISEAVISSILAFLVIRVKGNVAKLVRVEI